MSVVVLACTLEKSIRYDVIMRPVWIEKFGSARLSGLITILVVAGIALYLATQRDPFEPHLFALACLLYAGNVVLFTQTTKEEFRYSDDTHFTLVALQFTVIYGLFFTLPYTFNAILLGIWCGHLVYYMRVMYALLLMPFLMLLYYFIFSLYWDFEYVFITSMLYLMLTLFTVVMIDAVRKERLAKDESQELYRELLAAQGLLREATKQSERIRIARNIHDLVGHHLTALTINLQVASHKSEGEAKQQIDKSFAIAKLLLSDVREAVTEIREKSHIELRDSLEALVQAVPRLNIALNLDENLNISDVDVADTILKCVQESLTNSLKHGASNTFTVSISNITDGVRVEMQDNGGNIGDFTPGNGLTGIKERVAHLSGQVYFSCNSIGFFTRIDLPVGLN